MVSKQINDTPTYHPSGDFVLAETGRRLSCLAQNGGGSCYRFGGDEFAAIFHTRRENDTEEECIKMILAL